MAANGEPVDTAIYRSVDDLIEQGLQSAPAPRLRSEAVAGHWGPQNMAGKPIGEFPPLVQRWRRLRNRIADLRYRLRRNPNAHQEQRLRDRLIQCLKERKALVPQMRAAGYTVYRYRDQQLDDQGILETVWEARERRIAKKQAQMVVIDDSGDHISDELWDQLGLTVFQCDDVT